MSVTTTYVNDITTTTWIVAVSCANCAITFGISAEFEARRRADHRTFYCPNGHNNYYPQETDGERYKRLYDSAESRLTHVRDQLEATEHSRRAYKGQVTKIKKRVGHGVCPCCNRTFADLARHMAGQHPDWSGESS